MADKAHIETDKKLADMEKHLSAIYKRADKEIREKFDKFFEQYQKEADSLLGKIRDAKTDKEREKAEKKYQAFLKDKTTQSSYYKDMVSEISSQYTNVNRTAAKYVNDELAGIYALNYNYVADKFEEVRGFSFNLVDEHTVKNLVKEDKTLLPYKVVDGKKDERWNTKIVNSEVLQGIIQGESIPTISERLQKVTSMNLVSSVRNARTSTTSAENRGRMDMLQEAKSLGINVEKKWLSAHDKRVRTSHAMLNGEHIPIDDKFSNGLMYPADPDGRPEEVYNCRCTLTYVFPDFQSSKAYTLPDKPVRPKVSDYGGVTDEYREARNQYKEQLEKYNESIETIADYTVKNTKVMTQKEIDAFLNKYGVELGENSENLDRQLLSALIRREEELFEKYPQVLKMQEAIGAKYSLGGIDLGATYEAEAVGGIRFGRMFNNESFRDSLIRTLGESDGDFFVKGDETINRIFDHEFGHNIYDCMKWNMSSTHETVELERELINALKGKKGMSEYATTNDDELFAEAFAAWYGGEGTEFAKAFGEFFSKHPLTNNFKRILEFK